MLKENLAKVEENIQAACDRAGRKREEVTLIAVSKTKPVEMLQEAYDLGVRVNGENKAQELASKYEVLPKDIHWHMIGHIQRNKVKYIIGRVALIHSVDSVRLAAEISKEAVKKNRMKTYKDPFEDENKDTNGIIKNSTDNIIQNNYFSDSQAFMPSFDIEQ